MQPQIVQKKAGPLRNLLRAGRRATAIFFPKTASVRQTRLDGLNLLVWTNEYIGQRILTTGSFEKEDLARLAQFVTAADTCIDVGANIGLYSLYLGRLVGPTGRVEAFEPVRRNALLTQLNCELNGLDHVTVNQAPLSDVSGKSLTAHVPEDDSAYSYFSDDGAGPSGSVSLTLDDYCKEHRIGPVAFMKVDVEGAEFTVLKGAAGLLASANRPKVIMVEIVEAYLARFGHNPRDLCAWMGELGYHPFAVRGGGLKAVAVDEVEVENIYFMTSPTV